MKWGPPQDCSLFNITTLQALITAGSKVKDIAFNPKIKPDDLDLEPLEEVTTTLKLDTKEQTYLLYLWLKYAKSLTWEYNSGDSQMRELPKLVAKSMKRSIQTMEQEFVVLVYTLQLNSIADVSG